MDTYDIAIIGAGIIGCAIARVLSRYAQSVIVIEAGDDVALGASRANSGILHAGYDCAPNSLMAKMNARGNKMYDDWCAELEIPMRRAGSLVIAFDESDGEKLTELMERARINGIPNVSIICGDEARGRIEPKLSKDVTHALHAGDAGIICPYEATIACMENARDNGVTFMFNAPVTAINGDIITADGAEIRAHRIINAAGVYAGDIARMAGDDSFTIKPRRGEYILLDKTATRLDTVIFQAPSALGKGVLVSPTVDGNVFVGPTAKDGVAQDDTETTPLGMDELCKLSIKSVPTLNLGGGITTFAGVRAQPSTGDFILRASEANKNLIHAAGICSPGLTSAPAIAEYIAALIVESGVKLIKKPGYNPIRVHMRAFRHMSDAERAAAILNNPKYGRLICRCEHISEAEVVEAIRRGATSLDAVKRRTRAGMGRCQGGFCGSRVMEILARETGIPMEKLTKNGGGSHLLTGVREGVRA